MACEDLKQKLADQESLQQETLKGLKQPNLPPAERTQLLQQLKGLGAAIATTQRELAACLAGASGGAGGSSGPPTAAPESILQIKNPPLPDTPANMASKRDALLGALGNKTFPDTDDVVAREWTQPLAPAEDYDDLPVCASGWMLRPNTSSADLMFSHPFGNDWEFAIALDRPPTGDGPFDVLLTPGDKVDPSKFPAGEQTEQALDEALATSLGLSTARGLLGVEMDGNLVPAGFKKGVDSGHRVAVFGRWIVDTGHPMHRAEIHPPLMMASASVIAPQTTRALFTSRPYLPSQVYTTDQGSAYDDTKGDDGTFVHHFVNELIKAETVIASTLVEAHLKIKSSPYRGVHWMVFQVRPPPPAGALAGGLATAALQVSYHFTVRSGVGVQVLVSDRETIEVNVVLNSAGYQPPPLPPNPGIRYSKADLEAQNGEVKTIYEVADIVLPLVAAALGGVVGAALEEAVAQILDRGVQADIYTPQDGAVDILSHNGAVVDLLASNIAPNAGITVNDSQPYPVTGWLEVKWVPQLATVTGGFSK
jgi:hypothetical protein